MQGHVFQSLKSGETANNWADKKATFKMILEWHYFAHKCLRTHQKLAKAVSSSWSIRRLPIQASRWPLDIKYKNPCGLQEQGLGKGCKSWLKNHLKGQVREIEWKSVKSAKLSLFLKTIVYFTT